MNIVIITSRYPSQNTPYNHMFVHMRSLEMKKKGVNVTVFVPSIVNANYIYEGVEVFMMSSKEIIKQNISNSVLYLHLLNIYPFSKKDGWIIYRYILKNNIPFSMYVHGSEVQKYRSTMFDFNYKISDFLKWFKRDVFVIPRMKRFVKNVKKRTNTKFVFPSLWMKKEMETNLNTQINNYLIIPNGIDTRLFKFHHLYKNRYKLLTLRPLSSNKYAVDIAIDVMKYLPNKFVLEIYGKGHYKKSYQKKIKELNLEDRIIIKEQFIERNNLNTFFSNYGVFLSPTRQDAQGVTMCEAMASGLLTVSSDNTAIPEFISKDESGILENDIQILANKISNTVENKKIYNQITLNARKSMEQIQIEKTVAREVEMLTELFLNRIN